MSTMTSSFGTRKQKFWMNYLLKLGMLLLAMVLIVNGQRRRPTAPTMGIDAYRQRWMEYLKLRATTPPSHPALRVTNSVTSASTTKLPAGPLINGFQCERTFALFSNKQNPRKYHLCARSRENWYVYHYSCPYGTIFDDAMKKCTQERSFGISASRFPASSAAYKPSRVTSSNNLHSISTKPTIPIHESGVTEGIVISSEESSTEEEMGGKDVIESTEIEEVTKENDGGSDESNMISQSDNETGELSTAQPSSSTKKEVEKKNTSSKSKNTVGSSSAAGGRRPRILKKWTGYISKY